MTRRIAILVKAQRNMADWPLSQETFIISLTLENTAWFAQEAGGGIGGQRLDRERQGLPRTGLECRDLHRPILIVLVTHLQHHFSARQRGRKARECVTTQVGALLWVLALALRQEHLQFRGAIPPRQEAIGLHLL